MIRVRSGVVIVAIAACSGHSANPATPPLAAPVRGAGGEDGAVVAPASPAGSGAAGSPAPPATLAPSVSVTLGDVGLEAGSLDRTADPCVDFYQFACGGWIQNNPIPPDRARWSRFAEVDERNQLAIKAVLDDAARGGRGNPQTKQLGEFYASCMDERAIERAGTTAVKPVLAQTQGVVDAATWLDALVELHKLGISAVWSHRVLPDRRSATTHATYLDAAGLGLPDRDYYVKTEFRDQLDGYQRHVGKLLGLLAPGASGASAESAAQAVVAIETDIARLTRTAVEHRDIAAGYNPSDVKALARQVQSVDWPRYFKALGAPTAPNEKLIIGAPALFAGLDRLRAKFKPAQWASYFTYHLIRELAFALPRPFDDEAFALDKLLTGVEQKRDRSKRCIEATSGALGDLLGQQYVAKYFPDSSRQTAIQLVEAIVKTMADEIARVPWLADATKQTAIAKLGKMVRMIGYPDHWKTYDYEVKRDDFAGNVLRAAAFETHRQLARSGQPVERSAWQMNAYAVDAYYSASANHTALPAGILQPPFFGQERAVAANLGAIGMMIGHEISHGFDDQGAQFDADGNLNNWWQQDDQAQFALRGKCIAEEYGAFEALPRKFIQGQLTLGENIADLGGARMAFKTYRALRKDASRTYVAGGFTEDQQFFLALGQAWCGRERPAETERRLTVGPYPPAKLRVYGALRNMTEFSDAFRCVPGTPMRPAKTCTVW
jgi:putative endopeptidase